MNHLRASIILIFFVTFACSEVPDFSDIPEIEFKGIANSRIKQSTLKDTILISFSFQDGDGDIGSDNQNIKNVFLTDDRDGTEAFAFSTPKIPEQGAGNGVEGDIILKAIINKGDLCCLFPNGQSPCTKSDVYKFDTLYYKTVLYDRAGNMSNEILAGPIIIECDDPD